MRDLGFRLMALAYNIRDLFKPRIEILRKVGIKPGHSVLDYGCGPGSYIVQLAEMVGNEGRIYALDINPTAIEMVNKIGLKKNIKNLETIQSNCKTNLPDDSIDIVLLFDILHDLDDPVNVLKELHRVLKENGILSVSDHHLKEHGIIPRVTSSGFFKILRKGERTIGFSKTI